MKVHTRILAALVVLIVGCESPSNPEDRAIRVDEAMGAAPAAGFARAEQVRPFVFPRDHGPHPDYATEWWYLTGNLADSDGARYGYQFTLFRVGAAPGEAAADSAWRTHQLYMGHLALTDVAGARHYSAERFARNALSLANASAEPFAVWLGPWSLRGQGDPFPLTIEAQAEDFALHLELAAGAKSHVLQGDQGLSRKSAEPGNASYYYSYTRLPTRGRLQIGARNIEVSGNSWMDREWSSSALGPDQAGWDWFALQLDDGRELMFYRLRYHDGRAHPSSSGTLVDVDGSSRSLTLDDVQLTPLRRWKDEDGAGYPVVWRLQLPALELDVKVEALLDDQLMQHSVRYWEGAMRVRGTHNGVGYLEMSGYLGMR